MGKKFSVDPSMDQFESFDPSLSADKMPTNITGGKKASNDFMEIPVHKLVPYMGKDGSDFSRPTDAELRRIADSILTDGLMEPIIVRHYADEVYEILSGESRWEGAKLAGCRTVMCRVYRNCDDATARRIFSATNLVRRNNTTRDLINGWWHYYEGYKMAREQAEMTGDFSKVPDLEKADISGRQIRKYHRIHGLQEQFLVMIDKGVLGVEAADCLAALSPVQQIDLLTWNLPISPDRASQLRDLANNGAWSKEAVMALYTVQSGADASGQTQKKAQATQISNAMKRFRRIITKSVKPEALGHLNEIFATAMQLYFEQHPEDKMEYPQNRGDGQ